MVYKIEILKKLKERYVGRRDFLDNGGCPDQGDTAYECGYNHAAEDELAFLEEILKEFDVNFVPVKE